MRKWRLHTGGYYGASVLDSILQLDPVAEEWHQVGVLQRARQYCTVLYCTVLYRWGCCSGQGSTTP